MRPKVYIVKCEDYRNAQEKMGDLVGIMGGIERFATQGERIAFKVNLLRPAKPEEAVSTHPAVVAALGKLVTKKNGARPLIAESPGSGYAYNTKTLKAVYRTCEIDKAAEESGLELNYDVSCQAVSFPEGHLIKRFDVITPVLQADGVFNLCKLKSHVFMAMTGAVKNNFGVIPGLIKPGFHAKLNDTGLFADMLLDLAAFVAPRLSIMDAIVGMEGDGPGAGLPRKMGLLLGAENPLALDIVAAEIIGLHREANPILMAAEKRGLHPNRLEEVEIIGADLADIRIRDFKFPSTMYHGMGLGPMPWWQRMMKPLFKDGMSAKPHILKDKCIACGACGEACPVQTITVTGHCAQIQDDKCIRCYCCHEMCPNEAIEIRHGLLYRLMSR